LEGECLGWKKLGTIWCCCWHNCQQLHLRS
jgi:hypothetical protein